MMPVGILGIEMKLAWQSQKDRCRQDPNTQSGQDFLCSLNPASTSRLCCRSTQLRSKRPGSWADPLPTSGTSKETRGHSDVTGPTENQGSSSGNCPLPSSGSQLLPLLHQTFDQATGSDITGPSCLFQDPQYFHRMNQAVSFPIPTNPG